MPLVNFEMEPFSGDVELNSTALLIIDMQRDFLEPGGFAEGLGNDVSKLAAAIQPCKAVLDAAREAGILVMHTREGHRPSMADVHGHKRQRLGHTAPVIGEPGPFGRILIRGTQGHDIIEELYPQNDEPVIDKPGKGSFYATDLECILNASKIHTILVCGVTTEVCVHTTVREANDRGFHCIVIGDACASMIDGFHEAALKMIAAQKGIFGSVATSEQIVKALQSAKK